MAGRFRLHPWHMHANVSRLPGRHCVHYRRGRCLYQESLNPGYHTAWRCRVLGALEDEYDSVLTRAEAFGLGEKKAAELIRMRLGRGTPVRMPECAVGSRMTLEDALACDGLVDQACLWRLPECPGRCHRYNPAQAGEQGCRK